MWEGDLCLLIVYLLVPSGLITIAVVETRRFRVARHWTPTSGTVLVSGSRVATDKPGEAESAVVNVPKIEYEYEVAGKKLRGSRITIGEAPSHLELEDTLARYPVGAAVTVYYDPADPQSATLEREMPRFVLKVVGYILLIMLVVPPLVRFLGPPLYMYVVDTLRPHLTNPNSAHLVTILCGVALLIGIGAAGFTGHVWRVCNWPVARGRIVSSGVTSFYPPSEGTPSKRYKPRVVYTYEVAGRQYSGDRVTYGLLATGLDERSARRIADQYKVGSEVQVHYNPKSPGDSMVNPNSRWHYLPWLFVAAILSLAWAIGTGWVG